MRIERLIDDHAQLHRMLDELKVFSNTTKLTDREAYNVREHIFHLENAAWVLMRRIKEHDTGV